MESFEDYQAKINNEIQEILIEIFRSTSIDNQLEVSNLIQQIHRINHLIYRQKNNFILQLFNFNKSSPELIFCLEEIKNILLLIKQGNIEIDVLKQLRINIEYNLNQYQYKILGGFHNFLLVLYHLKSTPFKIFIGLLITTIFSLITMHLTIQEVSLLYQKVPLTQSELTNDSTEKNTDNSLDSSKITPHALFYSQSHNFTSSLVYTAIAGVLGSITSILLRIIQFKDYQPEDPLVPFFFGMFKPLIGLLLGILFFFLIKSDTIIKIDFMLASSASPNQNLEDVDLELRRNFFLFTCAFIVGFSERFASDILRKTEADLIKDQDSDQTRPE